MKVTYQKYFNFLLVFLGLRHFYSGSPIKEWRLNFWKQKVGIVPADVKSRLEWREFLVCSMNHTSQQQQAPLNLRTHACIIHILEVMFGETYERVSEREREMHLVRMHRLLRVCRWTLWNNSLQGARRHQHHWLKGSRESERRGPQKVGPPITYWTKAITSNWRRHSSFKSRHFAAKSCWTL